MDSVWVICISYDYGVWDKAGFFESEEAANKWIAGQEARNRAEFEKHWREYGCAEARKEAREYRDRYLPVVQTLHDAKGLLEVVEKMASKEENYTPTDFYAVEVKRGGY